MIAPVDINKIYTKTEYTPAFRGVNTIVKTADSFTRNLYLNNANNKQIFTSIQKEFNRLPQENVIKAYQCILDSSGIANQEAFDVLSKACFKKKGLLRFFSSKKQNDPYAKFGIKFITNIIEAAKDNNKNHSTVNLNFLENILNTYSASASENYFKLISINKDAKGIISSKNNELFSLLNKSGHVDCYKYLKNKEGRIGENLRDYVLNDIKKNNGHVDKEIFEIIKYVKNNNNVKEILDEVSRQRQKVKPEYLKFALEHSPDNSGVISLENFRRIIDTAENSPKILKYCEIFKDNNALIRYPNIDFVKTISPDVEDIKILQKYALIGSDKEGVVSNDFIRNLKNYLKNNPHTKKAETLIYCLERVKDADGSINWDCIKTFYELKSRILSQKNIKNNSNSIAGENLAEQITQYNIFEQILNAVKDKKGNISKDYTKAVSDLMGDELLNEIPYILEASCKPDGTLDNKVLKQTTMLVKNTIEKERLDIAKFAAKCKDNNGYFDTGRFQELQSVQAAGIRSNIASIALALHNPDNSFSKKGLNLVAYLRKNSHHQIEEVLAKIISLCRDNSGYLNDKNILAVKVIQARKPHADLSMLLKITINDNKIVDVDKLKGLNEILKQFHGSSLNKGMLNTILKFSADRNGGYDFDMMKLLVKIQKSGESFFSYRDIIPVFKEFIKYSGVTSFHQLNLQQKRDILRKITKYKSEYQDYRFQKYLDIKILPKNESDYCETLARLSHSIGINVKRLDQKIIDNFYSALKNMANPQSEFMHLDFDNNVPKLNLKYPLDNFKKDVWNIVKDFSYGERIKSLDYFGFELKNYSGRLILNGFPSAHKPDGKLAVIKDANVKAAISKLTPYVIKFTQGNDVTVLNNPVLSKELTAITKAFPEFLTTIGKVQHPAHDYTLDIHILKVLQGVFKHPDYEKLPEASKKHIQIAALLHDLNKSAYDVDKHHPENSAFDTYYLLNKFNMREKDKLKIYEIIKNHNWLARYNNSSNKSSVAKEFAYELRQNNAFELLYILTNADLKGVKKQEQFFKRYSAALDDAQKQISPLIHEIQKNAINLPQTNIPKVCDINHNSRFVSVIQKDGIRNTVIDIQKGINLKEVGFAENISVNDLNILVHGLDTKNDAAMFQALGMINSDALLSSSYINYSKGNWRVFRPQGFVLYVPSADIQAGYWRDFGSGYKKDRNTLFSQYLFSNNETRTYFPNQLKKELNLTDAEYINLLRKIEDVPMSLLDRFFPNVANAYRNIFTNMETSKRSYSRNYNEILVTRPKIQAVFCYDQKPSEISPYLRSYAQRQGIPILVFH